MTWGDGGLSTTMSRLSNRSVEDEIDSLKPCNFPPSAVLYHGKNICGIRLGKRLLRIYMDKSRYDVRVHLNKRKVAKVKLLCETVKESHKLGVLVDGLERSDHILWSLVIHSRKVRLLNKMINDYHKFDLNRLRDPRLSGALLEGIFDFVLFYDFRREEFFLTGSDVGFGVVDFKSVLEIVAKYHHRDGDDTVADDKESERRFMVAKRPLEEPIWYPWMQWFPQ